MEISKKLFLNKTKQLFDIHGNLKAFNTELYITSDSDEPFQYSFVNQTMLDGEQEIPYKTGKKLVRDMFRYEGPDYQNHFISLRSENPLTIQMDIKTAPLQNAVVEQSSDSTTQDKQESFTSSFAFKLFVFFAVLFVCYLLYTKFGKKDKKSPVKLNIHRERPVRESVFKTLEFKSSPVKVESPGPAPAPAPIIAQESKLPSPVSTPVKLSLSPETTNTPAPVPAPAAELPVKTDSLLPPPPSETVKNSYNSFKDRIHARMNKRF